jgi:hypothetical protein
MTYVELHATSHFSFLRGVSSCGELFAAAKLLGYPALGITDRNTVCGLVRGLVAADETGVRLVAGCRLDLMDGSSLLVWPEDRAGWSRLTRLLTEGKKRARPQHGEKGQCFLHWEDVAAWSEGLVAALVTQDADDDAGVRPCADGRHIRGPGASPPSLTGGARGTSCAFTNSIGWRGIMACAALRQATSSTILLTSACCRMSSLRSATNARSTRSAFDGNAMPIAI